MLKSKGLYAALATCELIHTASPHQVVRVSGAVRGLRRRGGGGSQGAEEERGEEAVRALRSKGDRRQSRD